MQGSINVHGARFHSFSWLSCRQSSFFSQIWGHSAVDAFHVRLGASLSFITSICFCVRILRQCIYDVSQETFVAQIGTRKDGNSAVSLCMLFGYVWLPYGCWLSCCLVLGKADLLLVTTLGLRRAIFEPTLPLLVVSFWWVACSWTSGDGSPPKILVMCQGLKVSRKIKRQTCSDFFSCQVVSVYWTRWPASAFSNVQCSMMRWHPILIRPSTESHYRKAKFLCDVWSPFWLAGKAHPPCRSRGCCRSCSSWVDPGPFVEPFELWQGPRGAETLVHRAADARKSSELMLPRSEGFSSVVRDRAGQRKAKLP